MSTSALMTAAAGGGAASNYCLVSKRVVDPALDRVHRLRDESTGVVYYVLAECLPSNSSSSPATATETTLYPVCRGDGDVRCVVRTVTGVAGRGSRRILLPGSRSGNTLLFWRN